MNKLPRSRSLIRLSTGLILSFMLVLALVGCGDNKAALADANSKLEAAKSALAQKQGDLKSAQDKESALQNSASIFKEVDDQVATMDAFDSRLGDGLYSHMAEGYADDAIQKLIGEIAGSVNSLRSIPLSAMPTSYQSAVNGYIAACSDLEFSELTRLKIDRLHKGLYGAISSVDTSGLSPEQQKQLEDDKTFGSLIDVGSWISSNTENDKKIKLARDQIKSARGDLMSQRDSAMQSVNQTLDSLKKQVASLAAEVADATSKLNAAEADVKKLSGS